MKKLVVLIGFLGLIGSAVGMEGESGANLDEIAVPGTDRKLDLNEVDPIWGSEFKKLITDPMVGIDIIEIPTGPTSPPHYFESSSLKQWVEAKQEYQNPSNRQPFQLEGAVAFNVKKGNDFEEGGAYIVTPVDVKNLLPNLSSSNVRGRSAPLIAEAFSGNLDIAQALINEGFDLNQQTSGGWTALMLAADSGNLLIAQALIAAGANLDVQDNYGQTALLAAASSGSLGIAKALIEAGADINVPDDFTGRLVLMAAAQGGDWDMVQVLLDKGANPNVQDGWTPLMFAADSGNLLIAKSLSENSNSFKNMN
ncbi:MAG TPA: ankyrin repeat domain-containing protein [Candidatus Babeliales bacterium]|nr:ankyrin repeat domain-containing protein [Candidatus Babeliales bacterium]